MEEYILIVDDDADIRNMLGIYLENEGYRFIKCGNAQKALEALEANRISLILLDVMMPGLDGIQTCMKIRERDKMPIIFMSAKTEELDIVQGLMAGGDDYVVKPFHPLQLMTRIKAQLRRYRQYGGHTETERMLQQRDVVMDPENRKVWLDGLNTLVNELFELTRLDSPELKLQYEYTDMRAFL